MEFDRVEITGWTLHIPFRKTTKEQAMEILKRAVFSTTGRPLLHTQVMFLKEVIIQSDKVYTAMDTLSTGPEQIDTTTVNFIRLFDAAMGYYEITLEDFQVLKDEVTTKI